MSIFEDKEYTKMDWLAQAVEPIISSLNEKLIALPKELPISYSDITRMAFSGYSDLRINESDIIAHAFRKQGINDRSLEKDIIECYTLIVEGNPVLNMIDGTLQGGEIKVVKAIEHFEEKDLLRLMGRDGCAHLNQIDTRKVDVARANEILELFGGLENALKSKSVGSKCQVIAIEYDKIMLENRWNIRNVDLSNRVGLWLKLFLVNGNLAALTNFCKLKVMTHNNQAIYSVQEEPV